MTGKQIKNSGARDAVRDNKKYEVAKQKIDTDTLEDRRSKYKILTLEEAISLGHKPVSEHSKFLVLHNKKVFAWFLAESSAQKNIEATIIRNFGKRGMR